MSNPLLDTTALPRFDDIRPEHAEPALRELIAAHRGKLAKILDDPAPRNFLSFVTPLEEMSHELNRVWSPVSHLQSVLEDPAWREAYNASLPLMTEHATELSQNKNLQQAYQQIADNMPQDATPSMQMLVDQELRTQTIVEEGRLFGQVAVPDHQVLRPEEVEPEDREGEDHLADVVQTSLGDVPLESGLLPTCVAIRPGPN